jgi:MFS family permease
MRVGLSSPLWREGDFVKFWSAATVSLVGDAVTRLALPLIAIVLLEATPFEVGVLGGAQFLPFLVVGLPAGAIIDRLARKRRLLVAADYARAAALLSVPAAYWLGVLTLEQLYAVALFSGLLAVFFDVTAASYLPALIRREHLVDGNSKLELSRSSAEIVGPGAAGLLIEIASAPVALIVDAVSFAASGTLLARLRRADVPVTAPPAGPRIRGLGREIVEGTRFVFAHEHLRTIALTTTTANFFRSSLIAVLLVYLVREADASAGAIGAAFAIGNIGFVAAALLAPRLARRFGVGPVMMVAVSAFRPRRIVGRRRAAPARRRCGRSDGPGRQLRDRTPRRQPGQRPPGGDARAAARAHDRDGSFPELRDNAARDDARRRARQPRWLEAGDLGRHRWALPRRPPLCAFVDPPTDRATRPTRRAGGRARARRSVPSVNVDGAVAAVTLGGPFLLAGAIKTAYDLILFARFRAAPAGRT